MSRFDNAIFILRTTGHPLFEKMAATRTALPLAKGIREQIGEGLPAEMSAEDRSVIASATMLLVRSHRYLAACMADGAMRHSLDGQPIEPVSDGEKAWAAGSMKHRQRIIKEALQRRAVAKAKRAKRTDSVGAAASETSA